jgi:hypothetical protein
MEYLGSTEFPNDGSNWFHTNKGGSPATTPTVWKRFREEVLAPVYPICTPAYSKYPSGVTSTYRGGRKSLIYPVFEKEVAHGELRGMCHI